MGNEFDNLINTFRDSVTITKETITFEKISNSTEVTPIVPYVVREYIVIDNNDFLTPMSLDTVYPDFYKDEMSDQSITHDELEKKS